MTSARRVIKRLTISATFLFVVVSVVVLMYFWFRPAPSCFDGIRNQGERGVDCGGVCEKACEVAYHPEDLVVREVAFVSGGQPLTYDVLARVYNPNDELGASDLGYVLRLKDSSGNIVAESSGSGFILPQETKTFLSVNVAVTSEPVSAEIVFSGDSVWEKFSGYQEKPSLVVTNKRFEKISSGPLFFEAFGTLMNDSPFDFRSIIVKVILRDAAGKPIAFNQTEMNTVRSKEIRDFRLTWPKFFPGEAVGMEVEPEADVYHSDNFIERYLPNEKFQELQ